jgi:hypothetical protein
MPYQITVYRTGPDSGKLTYEGDQVRGLVTGCWFDPHAHIPARTYPGCSATMMHTKQLPGIFIPNIPGFTGVFVHEGSSPKDSKACIVIERDKLKKVLADIPQGPEHNDNVTVTVLNQPYMPGKPVPPPAT